MCVLVHFSFKQNRTTVMALQKQIKWNKTTYNHRMNFGSVRGFYCWMKWTETLKIVIKVFNRFPWGFFFASLASRREKSRRWETESEKEQNCVAISIDQIHVLQFIHIRITIWESKVEDKVRAIHENSTTSNIL